MKHFFVAPFLCGLAAQSPGASISILNPNFGAQVLPPGATAGFGYIPITGWTRNDVPNTAYTVPKPWTFATAGFRWLGSLAAKTTGEISGGQLK